MELRGSVITVAQAEASGVTRDQLRGPSWQKVARGLYRWAGAAADDRDDLEALAEGLPPRSVFGGATAAWLHGLIDERPPIIDVVMPPGSPNRHRRGTSYRRLKLGDSDVASLRGLPVMSVEAALWDMGTALALADRVALVDAALHSGRTDRARLAEWLAERRRPHSAKLSEAFELSDGASESPMESRLRVLLVSAGLPAPELQAELFDREGAFVARVDLYYRFARLAIEYDGSTHKSSIESDNRRHNRIVQAGYRALRFTFADVNATPDVTVAQVAAQLGMPRLLPMGVSNRVRKAGLVASGGFGVGLDARIGR